MNPLDTRPRHPGERCYVLKLHRDADPAAGELRGRVENLASGSHVNFEDLAGLLAALAADVAQCAAARARHDGAAGFEPRG